MSRQKTGRLNFMSGTIPFADISYTSPHAYWYEKNYNSAFIGVYLLLRTRHSKQWVIREEREAETKKGPNGLMEKEEERRTSGSFGVKMRWKRNDRENNKNELETAYWTYAAAIATCKIHGKILFTSLINSWRWIRCLSLFPFQSG